MNLICQKSNEKEVSRKRKSVIIKGAALVLLTLPLTKAIGGEINSTEVGVGIYEMAYSKQNDSLYVASSQDSRLDIGGIVYRIEPKSLLINQVIHTELGSYALGIDNSRNVLYVGNTTDGAITAINTKTGKVNSKIVFKSEDKKNLKVREVKVDEKHNLIYVSAPSTKSKIFVVDGRNMKVIKQYNEVGSYATGIALDTNNNFVYISNLENEVIKIDSKKEEVVYKKKLGDISRNSHVNLTLDDLGRRVFVADLKDNNIIVLDSNTGAILKKINIGKSLDIIFNKKKNELYATLQEKGEVVLIDASSYKVKKRYKIGESPNSLALSDDQSLLYVSVKRKEGKDLIYRIVL